MKLRFDFSKFPFSLGKGTVSVMISSDRIPVLDGQGLSDLHVRHQSHQCLTLYLLTGMQSKYKAASNFFNQAASSLQNSDARC